MHLFTRYLLPLTCYPLPVTFYLLPKTGLLPQEQPCFINFYALSSAFSLNLRLFKMAFTA